MKLAYAIASENGIITNNLMGAREMTCPVSDKPDRIVKAYTLEEQKKIEEIAANHKTPYGRVNYKHQVFYDDMNTKSINLLEKYFLEEDSEEE